MSTPIPTEVIAEALAKHQLVSDARCSCGEHNPPWHPEIGWRGLHIAHQAAVVAALPDIAIVPTLREDWAPGRWWRVIAPDGSVWCETSDEQEARAAVRDGDVLERLFDGPHLREWRTAGGES